MGQDFSSESSKIVFYGLDGAGKTSILNRLMGENFTPNVNSTVGFHYCTLNYGKINYAVWDVGGGDACRTFWNYYLNDVAGIVYVVDSTDRSRMDLAALELSGLLDMEELRSAPFLVLANKQDLSYAMEPSEVTYELGLSHLTVQPWCMQGVDAVSGMGLLTGFDWLSTTLLKSKKSSRCFCM